MLQWPLQAVAGSGPWGTPLLEPRHTHCILLTTHASKRDGLGDLQLPLAAASLPLLWLPPTLAELSHRARPNLPEILSASVSQGSSGVSRKPLSSLQSPWTWDDHLTCFHLYPVVMRFSLKRHELVTVFIC